jgi:hypothetical protein
MCQANEGRKKTAIARSACCDFSAEVGKKGYHRILAIPWPSDGRRACPGQGPLPSGGQIIAKPAAREGADACQQKFYFLEKNMSFFRCLLIILALHLSLACGAGAGMAVKWDHLVKLDRLAERCGILAESNNAPELRRLTEPVRAAAATVAADPVPAGARFPDRVKAVQADLRGLAETLAGSASLADAELVARMGGIDSVVGRLMEAAGMVHQHESDEWSDEPEKEAPTPAPGS